MKNTNLTRPARQRPTQTRAQAQPTAAGRQPKAAGHTPPPAAHRRTPAIHPHDFLALCFYPGMADHGTAA